jgi:hypothetical protein
MFTAAVLLTGSNSRVLAQIEFAKSTLRVTSETAPQNPPSPPAQVPRQFEEPTTMQPLQQPAQVAVQPAAAQPPAPRRTNGVQQSSYEAPSAPRMMVHGPTPGRAPSVVNVYASPNAQAGMSKLPRPAPVQAGAQHAPKGLRGKPFQGVANEPAVSPYLSLYSRNGNDNAALNYFTSVRPQLQQQEATRQQSLELQKLRSQVQSMQSGGVAGPKGPDNKADAVSVSFAYQF